MAWVVSLVGSHPGRILDVGARDGRISLPLAERGRHTVALDLRPRLSKGTRLDVVAGDATALPFPDRSFETVICTEVLEHLHADPLDRARWELDRVTANRLLVTVPFEQDLTVGATRCASCGIVNPAWGHVNSFSMESLIALFPGLEPEVVGTLGRQRNTQPRIAGWMEARLGYPRGAWHQEEACVECAAALVRPSFPLWTRIAARVPTALTRMARWVTPHRPAWIYALFRRR